MAESNGTTPNPMLQGQPVILMIAPHPNGQGYLVARHPQLGAAQAVAVLAQVQAGQTLEAVLAVLQADRRIEVAPAGALHVLERGDS